MAMGLDHHVSQQVQPLWVEIKSKLKKPLEKYWKQSANQTLFKKIMKPLLLNAQYSLDHCKPTLSIYRAIEKFKQFKPVTKQEQFSVEY